MSTLEGTGRTTRYVTRAPTHSAMMLRSNVVATRGTDGSDTFCATGSAATVESLLRADSEYEGTCLAPAAS